MPVLLLPIKKGDELIDSVTFLFPIIAGGNVSLASPSPYAEKKTKLGSNMHTTVSRICVFTKLD